MTGKEKLIVILGPTAVGKTDLSIELAKKIDTEIISGDSMLFYRGFDIGSAKPSVEERQGIVHHLVDNLEPWESFNVTDFVREGQQLIHALNAQGKIPIIAGGTGLYIKALLEGYEFNETADHSDYRQELTALAEEKGRDYIHGLLQKADGEHHAADGHPQAEQVLGPLHALGQHVVLILADDHLVAVLDGDVAEEEAGDTAEDGDDKLRLLGECVGQDGQTEVCVLFQRGGGADIGQDDQTEPVELFDPGEDARKT